MKPEIVRRYRGNPILTRAAIPYPVETVHNAAVVKHGDEYVMLFRSHLRTGRSIIGLARSPDGFQFTEGPAADAAGNVFFTDQPVLRQEEGSRVLCLVMYGEQQPPPRIVRVHGAAEGLIMGFEVLAR